MPVRDTTTGANYEGIVKYCLERQARLNNFTIHSQIAVGFKPTKGRHVVDWELVSSRDSNIRGLLSCKYQGVSGTAEEKLPFEIIKLLHTMKVDTRYKHSWLVMGGVGWSPGMARFLHEDLLRWIPEMEGKISICTTDQLLGANISLDNR
jgi:hypothetical protein